MEESKKIRPLLVLGAAGLALALSFGASYGSALYGASAPDKGGAESQASVAPGELALRYKIPVTDTQPWRGPLDALVTVVEWCDLRGAACRAVDGTMRSLMKKYEGRLRWVHRHLPNPTHMAESRRSHEFARGAFQHTNEPDKFWEVRERLLALPDDMVVGDDELRRIADEVGVDYTAIDKGVQGKLYSRGLGIDVAFAVKFGVKNEPTLFVDGRPVGHPPADQLEPALRALIDEELQAAQQLVKQGVARTEVYQTLIKDGRWSLDDDPSKRQATAPSAEKR